MSPVPDPAPSARAPGTVVLAIDTTAGACSVAIAGPAGVRRRAEPMIHGHSRRVLDLVDALLAESGRAGAARRDRIRQRAGLVHRPADRLRDRPGPGVRPVAAAVRSTRCARSRCRPRSRRRPAPTGCWSRRTCAWARPATPRSARGRRWPTARGRSPRCRRGSARRSRRSTRSTRSRRDPRCWPATRSTCIRRSPRGAAWMPCARRRRCFPTRPPSRASRGSACGPGARSMRPTRRRPTCATRSRSTSASRRRCVRRARSELVVSAAAVPRAPAPPWRGRTMGRAGPGPGVADRGADLPVPVDLRQLRRFDRGRLRRLGVRVGRGPRHAARLRDRDVAAGGGPPAEPERRRTGAGPRARRRDARLADGRREAPRRALDAARGAAVEHAGTAAVRCKGFHRIGRRRRYYPSHDGAREDAIVMVRRHGAPAHG